MIIAHWLLYSQVFYERICECFSDEKTNATYSSIIQIHKNDSISLTASKTQRKTFFSPAVMVTSADFHIQWRNEELNLIFRPKKSPIDDILIRLLVSLNTSSDQKMLIIQRYERWNSFNLSRWRNWPNGWYYDITCRMCDKRKKLALKNNKKDTGVECHFSKRNQILFSFVHYIFNSIQLYIKLWIPASHFILNVWTVQNTFVSLHK